MTVVAAADRGSLSLGLEQGLYEGPLRMRIPVRLSCDAAADGAWSFEVPLPDPASQKLLSRCAPAAALFCRDAGLQIASARYIPSDVGGLCNPPKRDREAQPTRLHTGSAFR